MKYLSKILLLGSLSFPALGVANSVVEKGDGYQILEVGSIANPFATVTAQSTNISDALADVKSQKSPVLIIETLEGLQNSALPSWKKLQILNTYGYDSWSSVPAVQMDELVEPYIVDIHQLGQLIWVQNRLAGNTLNQENPFTVVQAQGWWADTWEDIKDAGQDAIDAIEDVVTSPVCPGEWRSSVKAVSFPIDYQNTPSASKGGDNFAGEITSTLDISGTLDGELFYNEYRQDCGGIKFDTDWKYVQTDFEVVADLQGTIGTSATVGFELNKTVWDEKIYLLQGAYSTFLGPVELGFTYAVGIDLALDVSAQALAQFQLNSARDIDGHVNIEMTCTKGSGCKTLKSDTNFDFLESPNTSVDSSFSVKVTVTPSADLWANANFGLYWDIVDLADVTVGVEASVPATWWYYQGTTCSDIDGDGKNDYAEANILDVSAELQAYINWNLLNDGYWGNIPLESFGWKKKYDWDTGYQLDGLSDERITKNIYFKDLNGAGGSTVLMPKLNAFPELGYGSSIGLNKRSCYPFADEITYEVDWGNGSLSSVIGETAKIPYTQEGTYNVRVRAKKDAQGRSLNSAWTNRVVSVVEGAEKDLGAGSSSQVKLINETLNAFYVAPNKCLDVHYSDFAAQRNGAKIQVWSCGESSINQSWKLTEGGQLISENGLCLDVHYSDYVNHVDGAKVQLWSCLASAANQRWKLTNSGELVSFNGMCLDVSNAGDLANGSRVQLSKCDGSAEQAWTRQTRALHAKNYYRRNLDLNIQPGYPTASAADSGWWSAMWIFEDVGNGFVRIKSRWKQDEYLHIENGPLEIGQAESGWYSAQWKLEPVENNKISDPSLHGKVYYIKNRWKPGQALHTENTVLETEGAQPYYHSAWWILSPVR